MARLCIVSRDFSMLYGYLMILLERELSAPEPLEMIVDRRRERASDAHEPSPPDGMERRGRREMDAALRTYGYVIVGPEGNAPRGRVVRMAHGVTPVLRGAVDAGARIRMLVRRAAIPALLLLGAAMIGLTVAVATSSSGVERLVRLVAGIPSSWSRDTTTAVSQPSASVSTAPAALPAPPPSASVAPVTPPPVAAAASSSQPAAPEPRKAERASMPPVAPEQPSRGSRVTTSAPSGAERTATSAPSGAERARTGPRFAGMPRVEIATEPEGSGGERSISYTARLSDPAGRPLSDADVSLHGAMPDGRLVEARLEPTPTPGTYAGRMTVGRQTPGLLRLRVMRGGSLLDVPVDR